MKLFCKTLTFKEKIKIVLIKKMGENFIIEINIHIIMM